MSANTAAANAVANNAANAVKLVQAFEDAGVTLTDAKSGSEITAQTGGRRRRANTRRNRNRKNRRNNTAATRRNRKNRRNNMSRKNRKNRKNSRRNRK